MFGIGITELLFIAVIALIFIGPKNLPEVAREFAKYFVQFKRMANEVTDTFHEVVRDAEEAVRRDEQEAARKVILAEARAVESANPTVPRQFPEPHPEEHSPEHSVHSNVNTNYSDHSVTAGVGFPEPSIPSGNPHLGHESNAVNTSSQSNEQDTAKKLDPKSF